MMIISKIFSRKTRNVSITMVAALALITLAACGNSTSSSGGNNNGGSNGSSVASSSSSSSSSSSVQNAVGNITNTPTTLADFTATVKAAGYTIISGQDENGNNISGATTESNGSFFVNVSVDGHDGTIAVSSGVDGTQWNVTFPDFPMFKGGNSTSMIYGKNALDASYVKSNEK